MARRSFGGAALLLLVLSAGQAAAFNCPGGMSGADQVTGYSPIFGAQSDDGRPVKYVDQTAAWKKWGPVTRVALYHSWNAGCLMGVRVEYGGDRRSTQTVGLTKDLATKEIDLAPYEVITRVDVRENAKADCIGWIKLSTNASNAVALGNEAASPDVRSSTINRWFGFLAAVRGYEQHRPEAPGGSTRGPLQQLQFVWGVAVCPDLPVDQARPSSALAGGGGGTRELGGAVLESGRLQADGGGPAFVGPAPQLCPAVTEQCQPGQAGGPAACSAIAPFTAPECVGGCCVSAGRCRSGFCGRAGLGSEVIAPDLLCWGTNSGGPHSLNRCRSLACKLAVPGCVGDRSSGACVGTVVALSLAVDAAASKWLGYPCLQSFTAGLPLNALGSVDINGAYAAKMWSICNCKTIVVKKVPPPPPPCHGPFCLFGRSPAPPRGAVRISSSAPPPAPKPSVFGALPQLPALKLPPQLDKIKAGAAAAAAAQVEVLKGQLGAQLGAAGAAAVKAAPPGLLAQIEAVKSKVDASGAPQALKAMRQDAAATLHNVAEGVDTMRAYANGTAKVKPPKLQLPAALQKKVDETKAAAPAAIAAQLQSVRAFANTTAAAATPVVAAQLGALKAGLGGAAAATASRLPPGVLGRIEGVRASLEASARNITLPQLVPSGLLNMPSDMKQILDSLPVDLELDQDDLRDSFRLEAILHAAAVPGDKGNTTAAAAAAAAAAEQGKAPSGRGKHGVPPGPRGAKEAEALAAALAASPEAEAAAAPAAAAEGSSPLVAAAGGPVNATGAI